MTEQEKLSSLKAILGDEAPDDSVLAEYLSLAKQEILSWRWGYNPTAIPDEVPAELESAQIWSVVAGINIQGAENQDSHSENGITRHFVRSGMLEYIRANIVPFGGAL